MKNLVLLFAAFCLSTSTAFSFDNIAEGENGSITTTSISNFSLNVTGEQIMVSWLSIEESNIERIELEKAENIEEFKSIHTLKGFYSKAALKYNAVDLNPVMGQNNYRLRLINKDGSVSYSEVISIGYRPLKKINTAPKTSVKSVDKFGLSTTNFLNQTVNVNAA